LKPLFVGRLTSRLKSKIPAMPGPRPIKTNLGIAIREIGNVKLSVRDLKFEIGELTLLLLKSLSG